MCVCVILYIYIYVLFCCAVEGCDDLENLHTHKIDDFVVVAVRSLIELTTRKNSEDGQF